VLQVADGVILATQVDATLVVARHARTSRDALAQGIARLRQARVRIVGAVLNAVSEMPGYYRDYDYRAQSGSERTKRRAGVT
jgi:Mrp family chromosome partitioning ATPase